MWEHTDVCVKQYYRETDIYLLSCLALEFYIIIDRAVLAPVHKKYVVDVLNATEKQMLKLLMKKILNTKLI